MKFGIIGYGNLGRAVASALVTTGDVNPCDIYVCDNSIEALSLAEKELYHAFKVCDINKMIADIDVLCLVVKGYVFEEISKTLDTKTLENKLVISFMAGVTIEKITSLLENAEIPEAPESSRTGEGVVFKSPVIARAMPSLAIATNEGVIAYTKLPDDVASIINKFGYAFQVEPEEIEKVTAFSACGLGFAAYLIDAFKTAGESLGFSPETAKQIAALTFKNACTSQDFRATVKAVATPGGATEQGILHMDSCDVYKIISDAMMKAYKRMTT